LEEDLLPTPPPSELFLEPGHRWKPLSPPL
jgi:hypothetical protein